MKYPTLRAAFLLLALAPLAACGGSGGGGGASPTAGALSVSDVEFQSLTLINDARGGGGLGALGSEAAAASVARAHSEAMRDGGFFGHADPVAGGLRQRLRAGNVSFSEAAENLVQVTNAANPAGFAHAELMASATHRDNILDPRFELVGIGVAQRGNVYWVTQIFIRP